MSTVKMYELIKETGLPEAKAEALIEEIEKLVNDRFNDRKEHLATKQDIAESKTDLTREIASVRTDLTKEIGTVRTDLTKEVGVVKVDLAAMEARLIKWTVGTGLGICGVVIAVIKLL